MELSRTCYQNYSLASLRRCGISISMRRCSHVEFVPVRRRKRHRFISSMADIHTSTEIRNEFSHGMHFLQTQRSESNCCHQHEMRQHEPHMNGPGKIGILGRKW